jgi:O-acetyl-ADP-ribose deacetylase (regulator of RNase III)
MQDNSLCKYTGRARKEVHPSGPQIQEYLGEGKIIIVVEVFGSTKNKILYREFVGGKKLRFVKGDILDAEYGIIGHQTNCMLVMGAGIAKQIRDRYPHVFEEYKNVMGTQFTEEQRLGKCQMTTAIPQKLFVANLFGQFRCGGGRIQYTDYGALGMALRSLQRWRTEACPENFPVYLPHGIGCGLAGGDWSIVEGIIRDAIPDAIIVKWNK